MEGFSGDGFVPQVKSLEINFSTITHGRYFIPDVTYYLCIVQTAGSVTDDLAIAAGSQLDEILDSKINDDFGFQILSKVRTKLVNAYEHSTAGLQHCVSSQMSVRLPKEILNVLNRGVGTERDQNIHLVMVGRVLAYTGDTLAIWHRASYQWLIQERQKTVQIR
jgi:hypothetical protein